MATMLTSKRISDCSTWFDLTTESGLAFGCSVADYGMVSVYIQQNGITRRLSLGKHFHADTPLAALVKARDSYKKADVKAALSAVLVHVSAQQVAA